MKRHVKVVAPSASLRDAARRLSATRATALPVCEGTRLVGLLSARDLTVRATAQGYDPRTGTVREVMTRQLICAPEDADVNEATSLMRQYRLTTLPVVDRQRRLMGIVSWTDLKRRRHP